MVGVGGRSKACDNCRRRRVKCDLAEPKCQRCIKARLQCGGCRGITIIPYEGQSRCIQSPSEPQDDAALSTTDWHLGENRRPVFNSNWSLTVPHDDFFAAFTYSHLFDERETFVIVPKVGGTIASQCFLALSTTYFGIKHRERAIAQRGLRRYSNALDSVHQALGNGSASHSIDVLEAVMIMVLIEFLVSDQKDGWIYHSRGLEKLFDMRGPKSMASLPCLMILERTRPAIIFAAIVLHQPTILTKLEWKIEPWLIHPDRKDSLKMLFDILADCPELFVRRDQLALTSDEGGKGAIIQLLLTRCYSILRELEEWERDLASGVSYRYTEMLSPPTSPRSKDSAGISTPIWPTILHYQSLYHANAMTVYNGALILVMQVAHSLKLMLGDTLGCEALQERVYVAGVTICRSVDYQLEMVQIGLGSFGLLFPLRMAYDAIGKTDPAIETWLKGVLDDISAGRRGLWNTAKYLLDIGTQKDGSMGKDAR